MAAKASRIAGSCSAFFLVSGCGPPSPPPFRGEAQPTVTIEPASELTAAPSILRLHVSGGGFEPSRALLVEGTLGTRDVSRLRSADVPSTVVSRAVSVRAWEIAGGSEMVVAPTVPLEGGHSYTLAAVGFGRIAVVTVDGRAGGPLARRIWPPPDAPRGAGRLVFCGDSPRVEPEQVVELEPAGARVRVGAGVDRTSILSDRCFRFDADAVAADAGGEAFVLPPPSLDGVALDPAPLAVGATPPATSETCSGEETPLGTACAWADDDRVVVRAGQVPTLLAGRAGGREWVAPLAAFGRFVVQGLAPGSAIAAAGSTTDLGGRETPFRDVWHLHEARPHVVINEVLANPIGAETRSEWVELVNDGTVSVDVGGWVFEDGGGSAVLPRGSLPPGAFALVVPTSFAPGGSADVPPREGTLLLRVERLGQGGISNSGETLRLRTPRGELASEFPALPSPRAGVSLARTVPSALDDAPSSFAQSGDDGASPGWENRVASP
jgi:hypothetical protein